MISICKKTHVSFTFLIIILLSFISGLFKDVLTLFTILIIHEIGHIIISCYYKWNISRIDIYACGGYITYDDVIDKPFKEEFMIAVAGIISQSIFFLFVYLLLPEPVVFMFKKYYLATLIFNLIPIIPLDGSKITYILLCKYLPYKLATKINSYLSFIILIMFFILFINKIIQLEYGYLIVVFFLIGKLYEYIKSIPYLFYKFLFERYYKPIKTFNYEYLNVPDVKLMKRMKKHFFLVKKHYRSEREVLSKMFDL